MDFLFAIINYILNGFIGMIFIGYIILLVIMAVSALLGFASPLYFISEIVMLLIAYLVYRRKNQAPNSFTYAWTVASALGALGYIFGPEIGVFLCIIIRALMFMNMITY